MCILHQHMNITDRASQIELNKAIIQRYFEAYNNKNEAIFDEIISPDYVASSRTFLDPITLITQKRIHFLKRYPFTARRT